MVACAVLAMAIAEVLRVISNSPGDEVAVLLLGSTEVRPVVGLARGEASRPSGIGGSAEVTTCVRVAGLRLGDCARHRLGVDEEPRILDLGQELGRLGAGLRRRRAVTAGEGDVGGEDPLDDCTHGRTLVS